MPKRLLHPKVEAFLLIEVQYGWDDPAYQWWLAGPPAHGTHPDPIGAWEALIADPDPFRGFEGRSQRFHGQESAVVRGFWRGEWVEHRFARSNDEAADEWARLGSFLEPFRRSS